MALILMVEDSSFQRNRIKAILTEGGYEIIEAVNGKIGLEKAESEKPDCILSDLLMPEMGGVELLSSLKEKGIAIPVIILSSDIQDSAKSRCMDLGAKVFLNKPPKKDDLLIAIKGVLK